ncbi:hypothetical protein SBADM41S_06187 [Streptomyces badius]
MQHRFQQSFGVQIDPAQPKKRGVQQLVRGQLAGCPLGQERPYQIVDLGQRVRAQMGRHDGAQPLLVGVRQVQPQAAAQEGGRELPLAVARDDDDRELLAAHDTPVDGHGVAAPRAVDLDVVLAGREPGEFGDLELALLEDRQEVVGQIDVSLVELVHEQYAGKPVRHQRGAQRPEPDEVADAGGVAVPLPPEVRLAQPAHRVVVVQRIGQRGPAVHRPPQDGPQGELVGHRMGQ